MDSPVIAALIAGVAAIAAPLIYAAQQVQPYLWFKRWSRVLDGAQTAGQRRIAQNRIEHHVHTMAARDFLQGVWWFYPAGIFAVIVAVVLLVFGMALVDSYPVAGWVCFGIAAVTYAIALFAIVFAPDILRNRTDKKVNAIMASARAVNRPLRRAHRR